MVKVACVGRIVCVGLLLLFAAQPGAQPPAPAPGAGQALGEQLMTASATGDIAAVSDLIAKGADINYRNSRWETPLRAAVDHGRLAVVKLLLQHGADTDAKDIEWGRPLLMQAMVPTTDPGVRDVTKEMLRVLLEKRAGAKGESLVDLIRRGEFEAVKTIVGWGDVFPSYLNLALAAAKRAKQPELVTFLIEAGAKDPGPVDSIQSTERLQMIMGRYRSAWGRELTIGPGVVDGELLLDRRSPGGAPPPRVAVLPVDLTFFRAMDYLVVVQLTNGALPPVDLRLWEGRQSEMFTRVGALAAPVTAAPPRTPVTRPASRATLTPPRPVAAETREWPSFRGPATSGVAHAARPPTTWDTEKGINIRWKTPIPGIGHSSPIVWNDRVFVTTAVPMSGTIGRSLTIGKENYREASGDYGSRSTRDDAAYSWRVHALDTKTGKVVWERVAHEGVPRSTRHPMQSQADATPATDGTHLVVWFGSEGLYCYDVHGKLLWKKDLGKLTTGYISDPSYEWTLAGSPVIYKNLVILQVDLFKGGFIAAFDLDTGRQIWRTERDENPSWATPLIYRGPRRTELVTVAPRFARSYDPDTGKELWRLGKHSQHATPSPIAGPGVIFFTSGQGNSIQPIYAVRPDEATGDITLGDDETSNAFVPWSKRRGGAYIPTPLFYQDLLYVCSEPGILSAYSAETGERVYQQRLPAAGSNSYTGSPIAADGRLYFPTADGDVVVVKAGPKFELLAVNPTGAPILTNPAASGDTLIIRTEQGVVAVAGESK